MIRVRCEELVLDPGSAIAAMNTQKGPAPEDAEWLMPTGLMLLASGAGRVDVVVVERRTNQEVDGSRAGGLPSRAVATRPWLAARVSGANESERPDGAEGER
jgi:hypothetical protein